MEMLNYIITFNFLFQLLHRSIHCLHKKQLTYILSIAFNFSLFIDFSTTYRGFDLLFYTLSQHFTAVTSLFHFAYFSTILFTLFHLRHSFLITPHTQRFNFFQIKLFFQIKTLRTNKTLQKMLCQQYAGYEQLNMTITHKKTL